MASITKLGLGVFLAAFRLAVSALVVRQQTMPMALRSVSSRNDTDDTNVSAEGCKQILPPSVVFLGMRTTQLSYLAEMLQAHPELSSGSHTSHDFFNEAQHIPGKSPARYLSDFKVSCGVKRTFDASANQVMLGMTSRAAGCKDCSAYTEEAFSRGVDAVRLVRDVLGDNVKFLVLIRHPLKVAFALKPKKLVEFAWHYCEEYAGALESWMTVFPRDNFMFLRYSDFLASTTQHLQKIYTFLDVEQRLPDPMPPAATKRETPVSPELVEAFDMQNQGCRHKLEDMTLLQMDWGAGNNQATF